MRALLKVLVSKQSDNFLFSDVPTRSPAVKKISRD